MGNYNMIDREGNIGYATLGTLPIRKDQTPYIGQRILDGRKSDYDWIQNKTAPISDLPRSYNPTRGFIMDSNNRISPDNAKNDYGSTFVSTIRSIRVQEMISEVLETEGKLDLDYIRFMQMNLTDDYAGI